MTAEPPALSPGQRWVLTSIERQRVLLDDLRARASNGEGDRGGLVWWVALERQARRFLRTTENWVGSRRLEDVRRDIDDHRAGLSRAADEARSVAASLDGNPGDAPSVGLRIAVLGKGGAGKSVISGTLARLLARSGRRVLAADLDTNPGLAFSLGAPQVDDGLPLDAVEQREGPAYGWALAPRLTPRDVVECYTTPAPDGVHMLSIGKIGEPEKQAARRSVAPVLQVLAGFGEPGWDVIADLEAGTTTPFERYHAFADRIVLVVGPSWRSALTARRLLPIIGDLPVTIVANRFRDEPDHPGLEPSVRIPFDPALAEAERRGKAPIDHAPDSPGVRAIGSLVSLLEQLEREEVRS